ncbi:helix-turn-helix domain-containing protein [Hominibacterium faecale]|uniref:helix-turn-helix domain-containing protein n=1 Tax=Hominibacterium faecale TaxID=2839743 RepID=UPI0022B2A5E7|nr:helix-turn-helix transcriptional regulator [Hominibacterium faecale]
MKSYERVKHLRKEVLKLTQQEFSESLNISRSNMGNIEIGRIALTDRVISDICQKYNVNEEWLRTGTGEMFKELTRSEAISDFMVDLLKEEDESFRKKFIEALAKLDLDDWSDIERIAKKMTSKKAE